MFVCIDGWMDVCMYRCLLYTCIHVHYVTIHFSKDNRQPKTQTRIWSALAVHEVFLRCNRYDSSGCLSPYLLILFLSLL